MRRNLYLAYGLLAYVCFLGTFLYLAGFVGNIFVTNSLDAAAESPWWSALAVNTLLVAVFALQHSVMARPTFKRWWTRFVPEPIERSTYVMATNVALLLLFWLWQPMGGVVWDVQNTVGRVALYALCVAGWLTVLATTFLINHFDLFGLRQVWLNFRGKPYESLGFVTPGPYSLVRHPLYVGWMTAFWATPTMTIAHLLFAAGMTVYMLVAIVFEERNLVDFYGEKYAAYRRRVPMLVPNVLRRKRDAKQLVGETVSA
jgi:protein-S-isoprenylcysteine O-methyltransferase Ste14